MTTILFVVSLLAALGNMTQPGNALRTLLSQRAEDTLTWQKGVEKRAEDTLTWQKGVEAHALGSILEGQIPGQLVLSRFGHAISQEAGCRHYGDRRRNVDH